MDDVAGIWQEMKGGYYAAFYRGYQAQVMFIEDEWVWEIGREEIEAHGKANDPDEAIEFAQKALPVEAILRDPRHREREL